MEKENLFEDESEECRWSIEFDEYTNTKIILFCSDDDTVYPPGATNKMDKKMNSESKNYESEEYR